MKKVLIICLSLFFVFLIIATVSFSLMKENAPIGGSTSSSSDFDASRFAEENLKLLTLNSYDDIKRYADEYPVYIQQSNDEKLFAIGEFYVKEEQVALFYRLNEDGTLNRFDGKYTYKLTSSEYEEVWNIVSLFDDIVSELLSVEHFMHSMYGENGAAIDPYDEFSYKLMLEGKSAYGLTVIDDKGTYWCTNAKVTNGAQIDFEFFRCFDSTVYDDASPNIDMREQEEAEE